MWQLWQGFRSAACPQLTVALLSTARAAALKIQSLRSQRKDASKIKVEKLK